jgi:hypothetical protein
MPFIFDEDSANTAYYENKKEQSEIKERHNHILGMTNSIRKQKAYNQLYPKLAIEGLTEEDLNTVW